MRGTNGRFCKRIVAIAHAPRLLLSAMADLKFHLPATDEVEVDAETLAAIDRGSKDADAGRAVSVDDVRKLIPQWISKFESQKRR